MHVVPRTLASLLGQVIDLSIVAISKSARPVTCGAF